MAVRCRIFLCAAFFAALMLLNDKSIRFYQNMGRPVFAETDAFTVEVDPDNLPANELEAGSLLVEVIHEKSQDMPDLSGKRVLIYHTHTYEAYEQVEAHQYRPIEKWRTKDKEHNVVAVGKALATSLAALGLIVEHDMTAFEPPDLNSAYDRSLEMLEQRSKDGEVYDLYIDLHRDAIASSSQIKRTVNINGNSVARFMTLIGQGTTGGYSEKPDWNANLAIAQKITAGLNAQYEGLARDVKIKTGRFNQHIADCCVLIECGMNTNTLEEVLNGIPYLAHAISEALTSSDE